MEDLACSSNSPEPSEQVFTRELLSESFGKNYPPSASITVRYGFVESFYQLVADPQNCCGVATEAPDKTKGNAHVSNRVSSA